MEELQVDEQPEEMQYDPPKTESSDFSEIALHRDSEDAGFMRYPDLPCPVKEANRQAPTVYIATAGICQGAMKSFVLYTIRGHDNLGEFQIERRYSDFEKLRELFTIHWPGVFIPAIPPKQTSKNLDQSVIEFRKYILESFLASVAYLPHLYETPVFQEFLRSSGKFQQIAENFKVVSYEQLDSAFIRYFSQYNQGEQLGDYNAQTSLNKNLLKKHNATLEKFEKATRVCLEQFNALNNQQNRFIQVLLDVDANQKSCNGVGFLEDSKVSMYDEWRNPYIRLNYWIRLEYLTNQALFEAINRTVEYQVKLDGLHEKLQSEKNKLLKIQTGKKTIGQFFSKKPKETLVEGSEANIDSLEQQITHCTQLIKVMMSRMVNYEIPNFARVKQYSYTDILQEYSEVAIAGFETLQVLSKSLQDALNKSQQKLQIYWISEFLGSFGGFY